MQSDRELLELAAKAAGLKIDKSETNGGGRGNTGFDMQGYAMLDWHNSVRWNPLANDGDALRLAVKLRMSLEPCRTMGGEWKEVHAYPKGRGDCAGIAPLSDGNDDAATRRAIVLAAAKLGEDK